LESGSPVPLQCMSCLRAGSSRSGQYMMLHQLQQTIGALSCVDSC